MNEIVDKEDLINTCDNFMDKYENNEYVQDVILEIFSELLNCSQDTLVYKLLHHIHM
mgnify:FL=1